nr:LOW QUALITY PROTEIN: uncharacterized protein LOC109408303 [Aedes albopictus]
MSRLITQEEITLGYASETDDYESEIGTDASVTGEPSEIYVGNTGKVPVDKYYSMFRQYGSVKDITFWRTHNHLYHCRVLYRTKDEAKKAVEKLNHKIAFGKRIRVSRVREPITLKYGATIRIEDIAMGVSEEDIYDHFKQAGEVRSVVKVGTAAYVLFVSAAVACKSLELDMILNGDPYTICRLSKNDRIDHIQVMSHMRQIKYRKPFVMVENYPELPFEELHRYKENFESIGPVRHFKIAATGNQTVTLALCMDRADDRDLVIDRFNDAVISGRKLKLYMAPGKARMTPNHVAHYAICKNSIRVDNVPPYLKDYEVCKLFGRCGATISFLDKITNKWIICFDDSTMVPLVQNHFFMVFQYELNISCLSQKTLPCNDVLRLRDPVAAHKKTVEKLSKTRDLESEKPKPSDSQQVRRSDDIDNMLKQALTHENPEAGRPIPTQSVPPSLKPTVPRAEESTSKDSGYQLPQPKPITPIQPIAQHVDKPLNWSTFQLPASKPATVPMDVPTNWGTLRTPSQLPKPSTELVDTPLRWNTIQQLPQQIPTIQQVDIPLSWNTSQQLQPPQPVSPPQVIVAPAQQQAPVAVQKIGTFSKPSGSVAKVPPMQKTLAAPAVDDRIGTKSSSSSSWIMMKNKELLQRSIALSNLPKGINEYDIRELFSDCELNIVTMYCCSDPYYPTSTAILNVPSHKELKDIQSHHHDNYKGKRVFIKPTVLSWLARDFQPINSLMLKNLHAGIEEEGILMEVEKILGPGTVEDVLKPTHHYAYFDLSGDLVAHKVMHRLRKVLINFKIDVFPLYHGVPKRYLNMYSHLRRSIAEMRGKNGTRVANAGDRKKYGNQFGEHNAHRLFVGNIPRITLAEDVIAHFNNFGTVIDYCCIEKKSCNLRKSAIVSFVDKKHARNAYCQEPHFLEGSRLNVHLMEGPPMVAEPPGCKVLTVKIRSRYLTDDEIREEFVKSVNIVYAMRFDAFDDRSNFLMFYRTKGVPEPFLNLHHIHDEPVKIIAGRDLDPVKEDIDLEKPGLSNTSPYRRQKDSFLGYAEYTEKLKEEMKMSTRPIDDKDVPYRAFYNGKSVQINNVSVNTSLADFQVLFVKFGDIDYYRELYLEEDSTKICFIKFKIDLSADLACTYNQQMLNGKRILVHLAKETLVGEDDRSVMLENLNPETTAEQIHAVFSNIGTVKYVQRQSPNSAIMCFKDLDCANQAFNVTFVPHSNNMVVNMCRIDYQSNFYNNFSTQERAFSIDQIQSILKPRILPEFHQLEIERRNEDFPDDDDQPQGNPEEILVADEEELPPASKRTRFDEYGGQVQASTEYDYLNDFEHASGEPEPLQRIESIVTTVNAPVQEIHDTPQPMPQLRLGFQPRMEGFHLPRGPGQMGPRFPNAYPPQWQMQQQHVAAMAYNAGPSYPRPRGPPRPMGSIGLPTITDEAGAGE